ncbi:hypothetical protein DSO57_1032535 [Entomophthora muscae]|uniref:Uncharacterized protein n=2 Tax=Entomophthora muscae TaxID=34485 RepID=A0ACC2TB98_9FUNG|nr:hypothetical protein DSO57_1015428 [Entomophthora muscae]KAJ9071920.1 hypothetical protein DSO57_1032535 [Entomophthora muscae]
MMLEVSHEKPIPQPTVHRRLSATGLPPAAIRYPYGTRRKSIPSSHLYSPFSNHAMDLGCFSGTNIPLSLFVKGL